MSATKSKEGSKLTGVGGVEGEAVGVSVGLLVMVGLSDGLGVGGVVGLAVGDVLGA